MFLAFHNLYFDFKHSIFLVNKYSYLSLIIIYPCETLLFRTEK